MKSLSEMTHYEILELGNEASHEEVERAYRIATATYEDGSLATYSLYEENEANAIRERIEQAYYVLANNEARANYDQSLTRMEPSDSPSELDHGVDLTMEFAGAIPAAEVPPEIEEFADLELPDEGTYDGARLRRTRMARGVELQRIADVTKVNPTYLACIEEERFSELPAAVYVRGFVSAYARCVGLDPDRVLPEYMERFKAARPEPQMFRWSRRKR